MTTQPTTPKRWRPRFSVRTLLVLLTLVCCYAACWGPTKRVGVPDIIRYAIPQDFGVVYHGFDTVEWQRGLYDVKATVPLVVSIDKPAFPATTRVYYFWFFGYVVKLHERDIPMPHDILIPVVG